MVFDPRRRVLEVCWTATAVAVPSTVAGALAALNSFPKKPPRSEVSLFPGGRQDEFAWVCRPDAGAIFEAQRGLMIEASRMLSRQFSDPEIARSSPW